MTRTVFVLVHVGTIVALVLLAELAWWGWRRINGLD